MKAGRALADATLLIDERERLSRELPRLPLAILCNPLSSFGIWFRFENARQGDNFHFAVVCIVLVPT